MIIVEEGEQELHLELLVCLYSQPVYTNHGKSNDTWYVFKDGPNYDQNDGDVQDT